MQNKLESSHRECTVFSVSQWFLLTTTCPELFRERNIENLSAQLYSLKKKLRVFSFSVVNIFNHEP